MSNLTLVAPIKGWVSPLEEVPDPVFAERILGDGIAIDPTDATVHAPCDAQVISVARHAVTLRAGNGAEILIHVGLETVALHGQGFITHVREGNAVRTGDPLITFDLDFLAGKAKSLISPVVITNGEAFSIIRRSIDRETGLGEFLMELKPLAEQASVAGGDEETSRDVVVRLAHGIHARPAAVVSNAAKRFDAEIEFSARDRRVNAKSIVALMSLGIRKDERVTIIARGSDAQSAVDSLADLIANGISEAPETPAPAMPVASITATPLPPNTLRGVTGAPGLAIGRAVLLKVSDFAVAEEGKGIAHEAAALKNAFAEVRARLGSLASAGNREQREILGAHLALLDDPELTRATRGAIEAGKSAAFAWRGAIRAYAQAFKVIDDARMRERVGDLVDLERQVMAALNGEAGLSAKDIPADAILIADELLPSELAGLGKIAGFCTAQGGPTSHVAILAAGMGVPALVSVAGVLDIAEGTALFCDADAALLHIDPDAALLEQVRAKIASRAKNEAAARAHALEDCRTADGTRIEIFANLGAGAEEAAAAVAAGAEGCGLLRTEFLFLDRETPPSEDEQAKTYQAIADALGRRPFKIRTFDIGGDKPVPYLPLPPEENPALGLRGIRAGLWRSDLLKTQLAAILRVTSPVRIMLPMIASAAELRNVRAMLDELHKGQGARPQLGIMVETPASAVLSAQLAREADFFSIGTNDLTQYALAMDRTNAQLAAQVDAFHPAVLSLIAQAAQGGTAHKRSVAVCGGLAGDPLAAGLLIGLGVRELSMPAAAIARVKEAVRGVSLETARAAAQEALQQDSADAVRAVAAKYLTSAS
ncbi:MAG TPA: phosphoenolpyruvate--protein phosphotransferase [Rhizomicrobium sp.]|jgi:phosphocarrier protein FPr/phosphocarrier protein